MYGAIPYLMHAFALDREAGVPGGVRVGGSPSRPPRRSAVQAGPSSTGAERGLVPVCAGGRSRILVRSRPPQGPQRLTPLARPSRSGTGRRFTRLHSRPSYENQHRRGVAARRALARTRRRSAQQVAADVVLQERPGRRPRRDRRGILHLPQARCISSRTRAGDRRRADVPASSARRRTPRLPARRGLLPGWPLLRPLHARPAGDAGGGGVRGGMVATTATATTTMAGTIDLPARLPGAGSPDPEPYQISPPPAGISVRRYPNGQVCPNRTLVLGRGYDVLAARGYARCLVRWVTAEVGTPVYIVPGGGWSCRCFDTRAQRPGWRRCSSGVRSPSSRAPVRRRPSTSAGTRCSMNRSTSKCSRPSTSTSTSTPPSARRQPRRANGRAMVHQRLSRLLHQLKGRQPLILYASPAQFSRPTRSRVISARAPEA